MLDTVFTYWWAILGAAFLVLEGVAIRNDKRGDTLSEHVWKFLGVKGYKIPSFPWLRRGALAGLFVWLIPHFFLGWW